MSTGDDVAEVRDLIFDPSQGLVTGFTLGKRGLFGGRRREVLPADAISSIGTHAVMVETVEAITDPADAPHEVASSVERSADVSNDMVVTESGRELGRVRDVRAVGRWTPIASSVSRSVAATPVTGSFQSAPTPQCRRAR